MNDVDISVNSDPLWSRRIIFRQLAELSAFSDVWLYVKKNSPLQITGCYFLLQIFWVFLAKHFLYTAGLSDESAVNLTCMQSAGFS